MKSSFRLGRQVKASIDKMISQLFRSLPKFVQVGDIAGFEAVRIPVVHSR